MKTNPSITAVRRLAKKHGLPYRVTVAERRKRRREVLRMVLLVVF